MASKDYYILQRDELHPFIPDGITRTLDIGCAAGFFSAKLKQDRGDIEAWGVEMDESVAGQAHGRLDKVLAGSFDDVFASLPKGYFDCIFFNDVLEHMFNPEECLTKAKELLSEKGVVFASIPNVRHISVLRELLLAKDWRYKESGILDKTHVRFFTKKSIIRMFEQCGYTIGSIRGINCVRPFSLTSVLNVFTFYALSDLRFIQFLTIASPEK